MRCLEEDKASCLELVSCLKSGARKSEILRRWWTKRAIDHDGFQITLSWKCPAESVES